ncbi:MAG: hypothetical protein AAF752_16530 [Bacteroidota bacterium]
MSPVPSSPSEQGTSMLDVLVALALLLTVLVPFVGLLGELADPRPAEAQRTGLLLARDALEQARRTPVPAATDTETPDRRWRVRLRVEPEGSLLRLTAEVYHRRPDSTFTAAVSLTTLRRP